MTEVIVRELRLRGYGDVLHVAPLPRARAAGGVADAALPAPDTSTSERLARRYSRQRGHDVVVDL